MLGLEVLVTVGTEEVGRTGAFAKPDVVDIEVSVADEEEDIVEVEVEVIKEELVSVWMRGSDGGVVEEAGILEETLKELVSVGEAVTVGLTITVVVAPSTPRESTS